MSTQESQAKWCIVVKFPAVCKWAFFLPKGAEGGVCDGE